MCPNQFFEVQLKQNCYRECVLLEFCTLHVCLIGDETDYMLQSLSSNVTCSFLNIHIRNAQITKYYV